MKNLLSLNGTKVITRDQQKSIKGGMPMQNCSNDSDCASFGDCFVCLPIGLCFMFFDKPCGGPDPE
ncbi:hypothetical protein [uncultured Aquimarina sp.]|uniref:hypothetical protein n=1 Tax=uncultured Aquimarina sp. TaxID=575652 RepID=UPI00261908B2|nr:hypothetical protein [uncultured Aquimarina sp.]